MYIDLYPQQLFTAEQAAAGIFVLFVKTRFFEKGVFWSTQAMFTAEQVAAGLFSSEKTLFFACWNIVKEFT